MSKRRPYRKPPPPAPCSPSAPPPVPLYDWEVSAPLAIDPSRRHGPPMPPATGQGRKNPNPEIEYPDD